MTNEFPSWIILMTPKAFWWTTFISCTVMQCRLRSYKDDKDDKGDKEIFCAEHKYSGIPDQGINIILEYHLNSIMLNITFSV